MELISSGSVMPWYRQVLVCFFFFTLMIHKLMVDVAMQNDGLLGSSEHFLLRSCTE